jgi:rubredoxin
MEVPVKQFAEFTDRCRDKKIAYSAGEDLAPNIVSSYAAAGIFVHDTWLSEGVYKDLFDFFDYQPRLKVNICDRNQTFVPFFNGHINWIASGQTHFWYLYVRLPKTNKLYHFPELIYTNDLVYVTKALEELIMEKTALFYEDVQAYGNFLYKFVKDAVNPISAVIENDLHLPVFHLPYYEGFNSHDNHYWLGIYRRNELFAVSFLKEICRICLETKLGELYATTWKSLIIKGITKEQRNIWDHLLGQYRINVRHAANELNWIIEDDNEDGLILKRHIIRYFDKEDVRTYGLCFAVNTTLKPGNFGSVIIKRQDIKNNRRLKSAERFEILYTRGFNPNSSDYILFRNNVEKEHLGVYIVSLCKLFYESNGLVDPLPNTLSPATKRVDTANITMMYQCKHCQTVYIEKEGEPENDVAPGTAFNLLPDDYCCSLCGSPKQDFELISKTNLTSEFL